MKRQGKVDCYIEEKWVSGVLFVEKNLLHFTHSHQVLKINLATSKVVASGKNTFIVNGKDENTYSFKTKNSKQCSDWIHTLQCLIWSGFSVSDYRISCSYEDTPCKIEIVNDKRLCLFDEHSEKPFEIWALRPGSTIVRTLSTNRLVFDHGRTLEFSSPTTRDMVYRWLTLNCKKAVVDFSEFVFFRGKTAIIDLGGSYLFIKTTSGVSVALTSLMGVSVNQEGCKLVIERIGDIIFPCERLASLWALLIQSRAQGVDLYLQHFYPITESKEKSAKRYNILLHHIDGTDENISLSIATLENLSVRSLNDFIHVRTGINPENQSIQRKGILFDCQSIKSDPLELFIEHDNSFLLFESESDTSEISQCMKLTNAHQQMKTDFSFLKEGFHRAWKHMKKGEMIEKKMKDLSQQLKEFQGKYDAGEVEFDEAFDFL
ncbi:hypothetical protein ADUPG1_008246 [Aduncisulcus paluster]|uniref:PH domain-containing protein n=1 Tax=Aduncisulcus paluster TaxID=2918883 RepID=A0ABQ5KR92_9EUKA|nr:hypothetical protein ADUPG1_008246 [Aduncisulcus paluster]